MRRPADPGLRPTRTPVRPGRLRRVFAAAAVVATVVSAFVAAPANATSPTAAAPTAAPAVADPIDDPANPLRLVVNYTPPPADARFPVLEYRYTTDNGATSRTIAPSSYTAQGVPVFPNPFVLTVASDGKPIRRGTAAYVVKVKSVTAIGPSEWSNRLDVTLSAVPGVPRSLSFSDATDRLSWAAPSFRGGYHLTTYEAQMSASSSFTAPTTCSVAAPGRRLAPSTTCAFAEPSTRPSTRYFRVRAYNGVAYSAWSSTLPFTFQPVAPETPATPSVTVGGSGRLDVSWVAPSGRGNAVSSYLVQRCGNSTCSSVQETVTVTATSRSFTGLGNGTTYWFRVAATNAGGTSQYSPRASGNPYTTPGIPGTPTVSVPVSSQNLTWSWSTPSNGGRAISRYDVDYSWVAGDDNGDVTATSLTASNLAWGTSHGVRVRACNAAGCSGWSAWRYGTPYTTPGTPGTPADFQENGSTWPANRVAFRWAAPADNGRAITRYQVERATGPTPKGTSGCIQSPWYNSAVYSHNSTATSFALTGQPSGWVVCYRVRAYNAAGWGPWSAWDDAWVFGAPDAPTITGITTRTSGCSTNQILSCSKQERSISFIRGFDNFSPAPNGEVHRYTSSSCADWSRHGWYSTNNASLTVNDTTRYIGTTFYYRIRFQNAYGWSGWSNCVASQGL